MAPQPPNLSLPTLLRAAVPGAINLAASQLDGSFIIKIDGEGAPSQQTTLEQLQAFFATAPLTIPARQVLTAATAALSVADTVLLMNLTVPAPVTVALSAPWLGRIVSVVDIAGNGSTYPITLDAGAGRTIVGSQTLAMDADWGGVALIGASTTQWSIWP